MKRLIIIILMMLLIPIRYAAAEDKETVDPFKDKTLMFLKGYLPKVAKYNYVFYKEKMTIENEMTDFLDCKEEQRRIVDLGRIGYGGEKTNPLNAHKKKKYNTSHFSWIIIPDIEESQPSGIIQFTFSY